MKEAQAMPHEVLNAQKLWSKDKQAISWEFTLWLSEEDPAVPCVLVLRPFGGHLSKGGQGFLGTRGRGTIEFMSKQSSFVGRTASVEWPLAGCQFEFTLKSAFEKCKAQPPAVSIPPNDSVQRRSTDFKYLAFHRQAVNERGNALFPACKTMNVPSFWCCVGVKLRFGVACYVLVLVRASLADVESRSFPLS